MEKISAENPEKVELVASVMTDINISEKKGFFGMLAVKPAYG